MCPTYFKDFPYPPKTSSLTDILLLRFQPHFLPGHVPSKRGTRHRLTDIDAAEYPNRGYKHTPIFCTSAIYVVRGGATSPPSGAAAATAASPQTGTGLPTQSPPQPPPPKWGAANGIPAPVYFATPAASNQWNGEFP